jgi:hypothetical protein
MPAVCVVCGGPLWPTRGSEFCCSEFCLSLPQCRATLKGAIGRACFVQTGDLVLGIEYWGPLNPES